MNTAVETRSPPTGLDTHSIVTVRSTRGRASRSANVTVSSRSTSPGTRSDQSAALPDGSRIDGRFDGLTDQGALRLALPGGGAHIVHAGDVSLV